MKKPIINSRCVAPPPTGHILRKTLMKKYMKYPTKNQKKITILQLIDSQSRLIQR
mgnify:CR=1 FL=1